MSENSEIRERLVRIETKIDELADLKSRVRSIERTQHWWSGVAAAAGALIGFKFKTFGT